MALFDALPQTNFSLSEWSDGKKLMGKKLAGLVRADVAREAAKLAVKPGLAVILAGDDAASQIYVTGKEKAALEAGFTSRIVRLPATVKQEEIIAEIHEFNNDSNIHGILVQLPLPKHLNEEQILQAIVAEKDADGFHYLNQGRLFAGLPTTLPCTPAGVALMLRELSRERSEHNLEGRHAVVVGRSNIVGKPMAQLLLSGLNMTVSICHSRTRNLGDFIRSADLIVSATGVRGVVDLTAMKPGAIVIDVGMHRIDGKVTGDLELKIAEERAAFYTPVPGGVGPMTIAMLLFNTLRNARLLQEQRLLARG